MNDLLKTPLIIVSLAILIGSLSFINGCKKDPFCDAKNSISGIIIKNYNFDCFPFEVGIGKNEIVVDSDSAFQALIDNEIEDINRHNCDPKSFPAIDFSQQSLLGLYASGGGCDVGFEKNVTKDDTNKLYKYKIKVKKCGTCKTESFGMFWVLVPKLPQDYIVEFEVK